MVLPIKYGNIIAWTSLSRAANSNSLQLDRFCRTRKIKFFELEKKKQSSSLNECFKFIDLNLSKRTLLLILCHRLNDCNFGTDITLFCISFCVVLLKLIYCIIGIPRDFNQNVGQCSAAAACSVLTCSCSRVTKLRFGGNMLKLSRSVNTSREC